MFRARAHVLIVRRPKLYYTVSGIITPIGGRPVHLYLNINQLEALNFIMSLFHASTCFEHHVLIVRRSKFTHKFYYSVFILIELYFSNFSYF